jgi:hypothetical protein
MKESTGKDRLNSARCTGAQQRLITVGRQRQRSFSLSIHPISVMQYVHVVYIHLACCPASWRAFIKSPLIELPLLSQRDGNEGI